MMTTTMQSSSVQALRREEHSTLESLANELIRQQESKADYVVDTRRMTFSTVRKGIGHVLTEGGSEETLQESYLTFDGEGHDDIAGGPVNDFAHNQIAQRLNIPKRYYDRMREDAPALLDSNVQHWFANAPETRMVRMMDGRVRAFLSNRYRRLDNLDLMEKAVLPELSRYDGRLVFHVAALTDERLIVRALLPDLAADVELDPTNHTIFPGRTGGDIVQAGVEIKNSEVGKGALSVAPFIWRLRCFNGLVISAAGLARYHLGREQEESAYAIYRDDTLRADDQAFWMKVRDAVGAALSETQFAAIVGDLRETITGERVVDPVAATERLAKTYSLPDGEQASILRHLAEGGDLSRWGMVNAITRAAKDADDFDRQAELETLGGELVAVGANDWARIAR